MIKTNFMININKKLPNQYMKTERNKYGGENITDQQMSVVHTEDYNT